MSVLLLLGRSGTQPAPAIETDHFVFTVAPLYATSGVAFNVSIEARDSENAVNTSFTGTVTITSSVARVSVTSGGTTANFTAGVLTGHSVTLEITSGGASSTLLLCTDGSATGTKGVAVYPAVEPDPPELAAFSVEAEAGGSIGAQEVGVAFNVRIRALDQYGETYPDFTSTVDVTTNGTLSAGSGTTASFTAGVLTHSVTFSAAGTGITLSVDDTATGLITGQSNGFTVVTPASGDVVFGTPPTGFSTVLDHQFSGATEDNYITTGNYSFTTDGTAPYSASDVMQMLYPAGSGGGEAFGNHYRSGDPVAMATNRKSAVYDLYLKPSTNFQGHDTNINKLIFTKVPRSSDSQFAPILYFQLFGKDAGDLNFRVNTQDDGPGQDYSLGANVAGQNTTCPRNSWTWIRVQITLNTGSNSDGIVRLWKNGVLVAEYTNIMFSTSSTKTICYPQWSATWGGSGDTVAENFHLWWDHTMCYVED